MSIKKQTLAGIIALAATAAAAQAAVVVDLQKTGTNAVWDEFTVRVMNLTGADDVNSPPAVGGGLLPPSIGSIEITLSVPTGAVISAPGTNLNWRSNFTNASYGLGFGAPPKSFVNFDTIVAGNRSPSTATPNAVQVTAANTLGNEFRVSPIDYTTGASDDGIDQTILAQVYISAGSTLMIDGVAGTWAGVAPIVLIPEPASLSLLGLGAMGLIARRRK